MTIPEQPSLDPGAQAHRPADYAGEPAAYPPPEAPQPGYPTPQPYPAAYPSPGPYPGAPGGYFPYAVPRPGNSGLAVASLVTSIVGFFLSFVGIGWLISMVGVVLGFIALNQIKQTGQSGRGMAIAGIVIGSLMFVLGLILLLSIGVGLSLLTV